MNTNTINANNAINLFTTEELGIVNEITSTLEPKAIPKKESKEDLFNNLDLRCIISSILGIDYTAWSELLDNRGMKPVKAAIRLGADESLAQLVADLKLATTEEEIDTVYADDRCLSCMTGDPVGSFWNLHDVGVIYSPNFRVLVGLETKGLNPRAYGFKGSKVYTLLKPYFNSKETPMRSKFEFKELEIYKGFEIKTVLQTSKWSMEITDPVANKVVRTNLKLAMKLLETGISNHKADSFLSMIQRRSVHDLPEPFKGTLVLRESRYFRGEDKVPFSTLLPEEYEEYSKSPAIIPLESKDTIDFLITKEHFVRFAIHETEAVVVRYPEIIDSDLCTPFLDFEEAILDEEEGKQKIKELGLTLQSDFTPLVELDNYDTSLPEGLVFADIEL